MKYSGGYFDLGPVNSEGIYFFQVKKKKKETSAGS